MFYIFGFYKFKRLSSLERLKKTFEENHKLFLDFIKGFSVSKYSPLFGNISFPLIKWLYVFIFFILKIKYVQIKIWVKSSLTKEDIQLNLY